MICCILKKLYNSFWPAWSTSDENTYFSPFTHKWGNPKLHKCKEEGSRLKQVKRYVFFGIVCLFQHRSPFPKINAHPSTQFVILKRFIKYLLEHCRESQWDSRAILLYIKFYRPLRIPFGNLVELCSLRKPTGKTTTNKMRLLEYSSTFDLARYIA